MQTRPDSSAQTEVDLSIQKYLHGPSYAGAGEWSMLNRSLCQLHRLLAELEDPPEGHGIHQLDTAECELLK